MVESLLTGPNKGDDIETARFWTRKHSTFSSEGFIRILIISQQFSGIAISIGFRFFSADSHERREQTKLKLVKTLRNQGNVVCHKILVNIGGWSFWGSVGSMSLLRLWVNWVGEMKHCRSSQAPFTQHVRLCIVNYQREVRWELQFEKTLIVSSENSPNFVRLHMRCSSSSLSPSPCGFPKPSNWATPIHSSDLLTEPPLRRFFSRLLRFLSAPQSPKRLVTHRNAFDVLRALSWKYL